MSNQTRPALPTSILFGATEIKIPPQTLAVSRQVKEATLAVRRAAIAVDQAHVEVAAVQRQMEIAAVDGTADEEFLRPRTERIIALQDRLADLADEQTAKRIEVIAARLGVDDGTLIDLIDLRELDAVEGVLLDPPPFRPSDD